MPGARTAYGEKDLNPLCSGKSKPKARASVVRRDLKKAGFWELKGLSMDKLPSRMGMIRRLGLFLPCLIWPLDLRGTIIITCFPDNQSGEGA